MGDEAVETLKLIWQEIKILGQTLGSRIDKTNDRLESLERITDARFQALERQAAGTNERLAGLEVQVGEMRDRIVESEMRLATEVVALAGIMRDVRDNLLVAGQTRMNLIEERLTRLEKKVS